MDPSRAHSSSLAHSHDSKLFKALLRDDHLWEVSTEKAIEDEAIVDLDLSLTIYDPLFQDILVEEDAGETSFEEEAQPDDEALAAKEVEFYDVLHNVIAGHMYTTSKEALLENMVMKDQIASLNTQVQGLEATVSNLNSMVEKFVAQMEYTNAVFVERIPQPVIVPELIAPIFPIQLTYPTLGEPDPRPEN
ncbi:hypothetical protein E6C27_scaffold128G00750 [Cucumis melo var. makuwa]|uniref:Uncharacterized protein n=1 Tax=Cucumis melo var. makuwa TaxID=1194695 RepID=A0A5A7TCG4_CUCMM|nr:hypothetical protein E6C27_scaffold128G00750 [Cucumis melo var. makuwa]